MSRLFLLLMSVGCWVVGLGSVQVAATTFRSTLVDAQWLPVFSAYRCELRQPLGNWGSAGFERKADGGDIFFVRLERAEQLTGAHRVYAMAPAWGNTVQNLWLGDVYLSPQGEAEGSAVALMHIALAQQQRIWLQSLAAADNEPVVSVVLEPMHFVSAFNGWQACVAGLQPGYEQLRRTTIYFPETHAALAGGELQKLQHIAAFLHEDHSIRAIYIDGHTDNIGNAADNVRLSKTRAQWVAAYLAEQGVDKQRLLVRWHGEKYPVVANYDSTSRDKNRRVTVRLERLMVAAP